MQTIADEYLEQGIARGMAQGREEEKRRGYNQCC